MEARGVDCLAGLFTCMKEGGGGDDVSFLLYVK